MCRAKTLIAATALFAILAGYLGGCRPKYVDHRQENRERCARRAIALYDTDGDGRIDGPELDRCPGLKAGMARLDPTGQRGITADAIAARIKAWQDSRLGRMMVRCRITHNGKPLADADVKFVPEKFLDVMEGTRYWHVTTATGKTGADGIALMNIPPHAKDDPPGVPPGFYRIEITKPGEKIPAQYNTDTTLGVEVAIDAIDVEELLPNGWHAAAVKFDLRY